MSNKRRRRTGQQPPIKGQFILHQAQMRRSPAWRALSNNALRAFLRLELEHLNHGGRDNGRLPVSYDDFKRSGIRRQSVPAAINKLVVLGFIVITEAGRRGSADVRRPSLYRLTHLPTFEKGEWKPATDDWQRIPDSTIQKHSSRCKNAPTAGCENAPTNGKSLGAKKDLKRDSVGAPPHLLSILGEEGGGVAGGRTASNSPAGLEGDRPRPVPQLLGSETGGRASAPSPSAVASEPAGTKQRSDRGKIEREIAEIVGWDSLYELPESEVNILCDGWAAGTISAEMLIHLFARPRRAVGGQ